MAFADEPIHYGGLIKRLAEAIDKNANNDLSCSGVTFSQLKILIMLHESTESSVSLKELERYFDLTQATIAGIVVRLEKKKLLEGFTDPADKRIKRVRITDEGRALCEETRIRMDKYEEWFLRSLNAEEREELGRLLMKIYNDVS